jgi:adenylosuccinate synthase
MRACARPPRALTRVAPCLPPAPHSLPPRSYDIVARFNGGANAGHTVVVGGKKYAFHLLPCGVIYPHTTNLLGNGTVVHVDSLFKELAELDGAGVDHAGRVLISDRAHLLFDFHKAVDGLAEERRAGAGGGGKIGTTKQGIGPCYSSKAVRNGVRVGMLKNRAAFRTALTRLMDDTVAAHGVAIDKVAELDKWDVLAPKVTPMIVDGVFMVNAAYKAGKRIITEGANAALLDIDFGTYPYVTSSATTAGGICTGLGLAPSTVESVIGVVKAYTTRVGGGPFPTELTDERGGGDRPLNAPGTEIGLHLQKVGAEIGVTTGRKRRCGWLDAVVVRYAHQLNGFTSLNVTKLDVLDDLETIKIGVAYKIDGVELGWGAMPSMLEDLAKVEVVYEGACVCGREGGRWWWWRCGREGEGDGWRACPRHDMRRGLQLLAAGAPLAHRRRTALHPSPPLPGPPSLPPSHRRAARLEDVHQRVQEVCRPAARGAGVREAHREGDGRARRMGGHRQRAPRHGDARLQVRDGMRRARRGAWCGGGRFGCPVGGVGRRGGSARGAPASAAQRGSLCYLCARSL